MFLLAEEVVHHGEPAFSPYFVGGATLALLLALLVGLLMFGKGREHS